MYFVIFCTHWITRVLVSLRYQYYLQVKKEVLDGRLHCTVEQGIRLAGLAVQGKCVCVCVRERCYW